MNEKKETQGLQWIHKATFLLLADALTILFSYFAALLLRFDFAMSTIPREYLLGYILVHAFLGCGGDCCILRLQAVS